MAKTGKVLQYYGSLYCDTQEKLHEVLTLLSPAGFEFVYQTPVSGTLAKEVDDESENSPVGE